MTSETRYFRSDEWTVNGLLANKLILTLSAVQSGYWAQGSGNQTVYWGIRVWKRTSGGAETEITAGTPVAQVSRSDDGQGYQNNTWACPGASLLSTDAIVVRPYQKIGNGAWALCDDWITEQLGATILSAVTWTVYYYTYRYYDSGPNATYAELFWDTVGTQTRIENFTWSAYVTYYQTLSATEVSVATLSRISTRYRTLSATSTGIASLTMVKTFSRTLSATASTIATMGKTISKTLSAVEVSLPTLSKRMFVTLSAQASSVASLLAEKYIKWKPLLIYVPELSIWISVLDQELGVFVG